MITTKTFFFLLSGCVFSNTLMAQLSAVNEMKESTYTYIQASIEKEKQEIHQYLDSIKFANTSVSDPIVFTDEDVQFVRRLKALEHEIPLNYSPDVKQFITKYTSKNYNDYMCKMLGLAQHYFPLFDRALSEIGVPNAVKYLSIVESSLNPHDVSRSGATGPWQFMYGTAKLYDLTMDGYIDERKDPIASSYAAAKYIKEAYEQFGDWLVAIASYNCGKGAVSRAILRSGKLQPNFWEIAAYLPRETQQYIPKFIAMNYAMGYAEDYGIEARETDLSLQTEVIDVNRMIRLSDVATALAIPTSILTSLNPHLKKGIVNGSENHSRRLILPRIEEDKMDRNALYAVLNTSSVNSDDNPVKPDVNQRWHRTLKGETLASISAKYGVSMQDVKSWNGLNRNTVTPGQKLLIKGEENLVSAQLAARTQKVIKQTNTSRTAYYTVRKGDTLSDIANKHGVSVKRIQSENAISGSRIKPGMKLQINRK